ncbi:flagellar basal body L-ring protein FlgH [Trinickia caryophylli]|uniref:Flagellar L-ring protein FlgH n=1 Tax=Trinickia caryophylli TaxID=28094 RepID=A0A1X7F4F6_TRICW|nr:flagellar basal body L-ring protein FlgH [Trinickia caryophylli]PMS10446.1 flagellar biosynthesis protein FlgH [Trinickia caryophylli]TRX19436.1 flagellar basal body L-ring protein FlgH [Trinickia caryophylli]WQE13259.1 flagellar basal body L-ring protein FlgH [Trinickia caryophylli]SMF45725.1 flagellar L-ring protein precursor FlgH [Trinickia caryophylli]GLU34423.1 flagellar L-ring protein [Trinickia caryophylli]
MTVLRLVTVAGAAASLAACAGGHDSIVDVPMQPPVAAAPLNVNTMGAIYQAGTPLLLYETPRAQRIGDVLTIRLAESYSSNDSIDMATKRQADMTAKAADGSSRAIQRLARFFNVGTATNDFTAKGSLSNANGMSGTLAVTVIGTTAGGNFVVAGEKIISLKGNRERLRLQGIVNPKDIEAGNYVESSKVANARIEEAGFGTLSDGTTVGWLQRMFMSVMAF